MSRVSGNKQDLYLKGIFVSLELDADTKECQRYVKPTTENPVEN